MGKIKIKLLCLALMTHTTNIGLILINMTSHHHRTLVLTWRRRLSKLQWPKNRRRRIKRRRSSSAGTCKDLLDAGDWQKLWSTLASTTQDKLTMVWICSKKEEMPTTGTILATWVKIGTVPPRKACSCGCQPSREWTIRLRLKISCAGPMILLTNSFPRTASTLLKSNRMGSQGCSSLSTSSERFCVKTERVTRLKASIVLG